MQVVKDALGSPQVETMKHIRVTEFRAVQFGNTNTCMSGMQIAD